MDKTKLQTMEHIDNVRTKLSIIIKELIERQNKHDQSKLNTPEVEIFHEYTPRLKNLTYNSEEYKQCLENMNVAIKHHYENNRHHPEHFSNGIQGMNLVDLIEMFCDWVSATERHDNGDIYKSININKERFNYSDDLVSIFKNTVELLDSKKQH